MPGAIAVGLFESQVPDESGMSCVRHTAPDLCSGGNEAIPTRHLRHQLLILDVSANHIERGSADGGCEPRRAPRGFAPPEIRRTVAHDMIVPGLGDTCVSQ